METQNIGDFIFIILYIFLLGIVTLPAILFIKLIFKDLNKLSYYFMKREFYIKYNKYDKIKNKINIEESNLSSSLNNKFVILLYVYILAITGMFFIATEYKDIFGIIIITFFNLLALPLITDFFDISELFSSLPTRTTILCNYIDTEKIHKDTSLLSYYHLNNYNESKEIREQTNLMTNTINIILNHYFKICNWTDFDVYVLENKYIFYNLILKKGFIQHNQNIFDLSYNNNYSALIQTSDFSTNDKNKNLNSQNNLLRTKNKYCNHEHYIALRYVISLNINKNKMYEQPLIEIILVKTEADGDFIIGTNFKDTMVVNKLTNSISEAVADNLRNLLKELNLK